MSQNHLILIIFLELFILYLIAYSIKVARRWINKKFEKSEELCSELPDSCRKLRKEMKNFNHNIKKKFIPQPLTTSEINSIFGEIGAEFLKSKLPMFSVDKRIMILTTLYKLWKIRGRILATFAQRLLKSAF